MKKILYSFVVVLALCCSIGFGAIKGCFVSFAQQGEPTSVAEELVPIIEKHLNDFVQPDDNDRLMANRLAGSDGERAAAEYLASTLNGLGLVSQTQDNGLQQFEVFSSLQNKKVSSQNVIYSLKGNADAKYRVILTTQYDNYYDAYLDDNYDVTSADSYSQGINYSAAGVATMLALAEYLPSNTLPVNIDFVFFGASVLDNAGAKHYSAALSKQTRQQTLLLVDISDIALGSGVYYYTGEFSTAASKSYTKLNMLENLIKFSNGFAGAASSNTTIDALGYYTPGYCGATSVFLGQTLNVLHIFSGDYSDGVFAGKQEHKAVDNISNTSKDNLDYIKYRYGQEYLNNCSVAASAIVGLISHSQFVAVHTGSGNTSGYWFFSNFGLHKLLLVLTLIALLAITFIIYYGIYKKTYAHAFNNKLKGVMLTLQDEDLSTEEHSKDNSGDTKSEVK